MRLPSLSRHRQAGHGRGQSLVEFALMLPVVLLIVLVAIDFGRALYGWVILQNSARIAANFAGTHPQGWQPPGQQAVKDDYVALIRQDLDTANCETAVIPAPVFADGPDTPVAGGNPDTDYDVGDTATVALTCDFRPLTPVISAIVGSVVELGASSEFRVRAGGLVGLANPTQIPPPPPPPTPTPTPTATPTGGGGGSCTASVAITQTPQDPPPIRSGEPVDFTAIGTATGCTIDDYDWTFPSGSPATASGAGPHSVSFTVGSNNTDLTVTVIATTSDGTQVTDTETIRANR